MVPSQDVHRADEASVFSACRFTKAFFGGNSCCDVNHSSAAAKTSTNVAGFATPASLQATHSRSKVAFRTKRGSGVPDIKRSPSPNHLPRVHDYHSLWKHVAKCAHLPYHPNPTNRSIHERIVPPRQASKRPFAVTSRCQAEEPVG